MKRDVELVRKGQLFHSGALLPLFKRGCIVLLLLSASACGGSTSPTAPSPNTFHAELTDAAGDAVASASVPNLPDLAHGTVDVSGGTITFNIQFVSGTFDRQSTRITIELDTDQNVVTGIAGAAGVGIDYILDLWAPTNQATVQQAIPATCATGGACYSVVGGSPLNFGTDSMAVTVSLATLGNASGRLNYRVFAYVSPQGTAATVVADVMPDINRAPAHVP
jgi:hypothetical protein